MKETKLSPSAQIKAWRAKRKFSQAQAALHLGVKRGTLQSWERQKSRRTPNQWFWEVIKKQLK